MDTAIICGLISAASAIIVSVITAVYNNKLLVYRLEQLEVKVNSLIKRDDDITILGHTFHGLQDVRQHCEMTASVRSQLHCFPTKEYIPLKNIHIGEIYESYPIFDSYDYSDNRCYENYIFASKPITQKLMQQYANLKHECNYCMVHEHIPAENLPILYYVGEGPYMVLATPKL